MTEHNWRERSPDGPRLFTASRFGRRWRIKTRLKSEEDWAELAPPWKAPVLVSLRDILWAKYQRKRLPFEVVHEIDQQLPEELRMTTDEKEGGLRGRDDR